MLKTTKGQRERDENKFDQRDEEPQIRTWTNSATPEEEYRNKNKSIQLSSI